MSFDLIPAVPSEVQKKLICIIVELKTEKCPFVNGYTIDCLHSLLVRYSVIDLTDKV